MNLTKDDNSRHPRKWTRAAVALVEAPTLEEAASMACCSVRTLQRWLANPAFQELLAIVEHSFFEAVSRHLIGVSRDAVATLVAVSTDPSMPTTARIRACVALLDASLRFREASSLDARLSKVEEVIDATQA